MIEFRKKLKNFGSLEALVLSSLAYVVIMLIWTASTRSAVVQKANDIKANHKLVVEFINNQINKCSSNEKGTTSWGDNCNSAWISSKIVEHILNNIKLNNLAKVLPIIGSDVTNSHPAILGLCEVENKQVLIDLVSTEKMKDLNYGIIHFDSKDWRGIDVALLFDTTKFIPRKAKAYPLEVEYKGKPSFSRDVLVVFGFLEKEPINFIVNHWPSRGGGQPSIAQRFKAGELNRRIIDSILSINPKSKIQIPKS